MRDYRALELGPDGHSTSQFDFLAQDDEAAKEQARWVAPGEDVELWRHDRKVAQWRGHGDVAETPRRMHSIAFVKASFAAAVVADSV
jgi:hypothetical protein